MRRGSAGDGCCGWCSDSRNSAQEAQTICSTSEVRSPFYCVLVIAYYQVVTVAVAPDLTLILLVSFAPFKESLKIDFTFLSLAD